MLDPLESLTAKCTRPQPAKLEAKGVIRQIFTTWRADVGVTPTGEAGLTGVLVLVAEPAENSQRPVLRPQDGLYAIFHAH
jgi:hypothetical protein